jgi:hypothetical protein
MTSLDPTSLHRFLLHSIDGLTPELAEQFLTLPADAKFQPVRPLLVSESVPEATDRVLRDVLQRLVKGHDD